MKITLKNRKFRLVACGLCLIAFGIGLVACKQEAKSQTQDNPRLISNSNLKNIPAILDSGSCVNSREILRIILTSSDTTKTEFSIPIAYLNMGFNLKGGEQDVIGLAAILRDMKPACGSPEYTSSNNEIWNNEIINLDLRPGIPEGFYKTYNRYKNEEYTDFVFNDEFGFPVYRGKQDIGKNKGFKEFLIPPDNLFSRPSYIFCTRPGLQSSDGSRAKCEVIQQYRPHIRLSYSVQHSQLGNLKEIDHKVDQLLSNFLASKTEN